MSIGNGSIRLPELNNLVLYGGAGAGPACANHYEQSGVANVAAQRSRQLAARLGAEPICEACEAAARQLLRKPGDVGG